MTPITSSYLGFIAYFSYPLDGIAKKTVDPLTDGLPIIPVQTVTSDVAVRLLSNITGKQAPADWQGGLNITYHIGRKSRGT